MQWILTHVAYVEAADGYFLSCNGDVVEKHLSEIPGLDFHRILPFSGAWSWFTRPGYAPMGIAAVDHDRQDAFDHASFPYRMGRHDGILPVPLAQGAYDRLGTPAAEKTIVIFENSAHSPMFEERAGFNQTVIDFIDLYKN